MGRPRNEEELERLRETAFKLFSTKGVEATSYSDIAKNAYVTKSHVQHYFPKKEDLVSAFVRRSLDGVITIAREVPGYESADPLKKLIYIDYIQFYYALKDERMIRMSMDILMERSITRAVINTGVEVDMLFMMKFEELKDVEGFEETLRFLYGGIYDCLYDGLSKGDELDIKKFILYGIRLLSPFVKTDVSEDFVENLASLNPWLEERKSKFNRMLFRL